MSKEIAEEYASSLGDLTVNSKPLINMLTILAEENIDHAGVIVETVEKHLEKVPADIKLPVLYLVDSIIKNVGGAYTQKFAQIIVNMFTRTFKQVDERVRSQMFKLRETWHDVFPATKLYQLDVKVNLIDPAWPIQAQPQQANIHVNPIFLKKPLATTSSTTPLAEEEEKMRNILAKKEQELLMLQRKKVEMELEQTRRQLSLAEKNAKKKIPAPTLQGPPPTMPVALVNPVVAPLTVNPVAIAPPDSTVPVKQRLGPPVNKPLSGARITPVSSALVAARRDPRLLRRQQQTAPPPLPTPQIPPVSRVPPIAPNVFDIKPLERNVTKRKNVITIDVKQDVPAEPRSRDLRRHDPRLEKREDRQRRDRNRPRDERNKKSEDEKKRVDIKKNDIDKKSSVEKKADEKIELNKINDKSVNDIMDKLQIADPKKINKLPPIPKIIRDEVKDKEIPSPPKRRKDLARNEKKKKRDNSTSSKDSSGSSSPEKKIKDRKEKNENREVNHKTNNKEEKMEVSEEIVENEVVAFKELKNYHKERYMRRNKEKSESPEKIVEEKKVEKEDKTMMEIDSSNVPEVIVENKDVDLRVLSVGVPPIVSEIKPAHVAHKRSSTETTESKPKKNKLDKFDILFGSEDVDLRQLPQVEEIVPPPPPVISEPSKVDPTPEEPPKSKSPPIHTVVSPLGSPKRDWNELKEKEAKKAPSKLDLVRAKLAEATKGKDRLGRPLLFNKSPSIERERRRTLSSEDADLRNDSQEEFDADDHKKTISIIMSQAKEQFNDGQLDKNQYNTLMFQVMQLNEKLKLKEAKQRESLEVSKRKLKAHIEDETPKPVSPKSNSEHNKFGDIDERIQPPIFLDTPPDSQGFLKDSDMRVPIIPNDMIDGPKSMKGLLPLPPMMPMMMPPFPLPWRGPRIEEFGPRRTRGPPPPFLRTKFDKRGLLGPIDPLMMPLPVPKLGTCQGESPLQPYERTSTPPPLGAPGVNIPPTDFRLLEYIDQDPMKTIQIDGIQREIRFYGDTAVVMLDWDDPREISFLPGSRRVTFDNKDSIILSFNEGYRQVEIDDQVFDIKFGAPTRELLINGRWYDCLFGGQPIGVIIDGKPRLIHVEGPLPQVDIGKEKRTDLVAGKINLIIDAMHMCPIFLDAKVQKFRINTDFFTIRFVDSLRTVLINEQPFQVEFGGLPRPIFVGDKKHFIRFSVLPRHVKPGHMEIMNMDGCGMPAVVTPPPAVEDDKSNTGEMEVDPVPLPAQNRTPSPEGVSQGLDMLASVMPTDMAPSSGSEYVSSEPLFVKPDKIPGLETPSEEKPPSTNASLPILENINVNDLFAKLVATGIVQLPTQPKKEEPKEEIKADDPTPRPIEDKSVIHSVDLLRPETLRVKQSGLVAKLYGGMQCSGCGTRFPPEQTVRYSQHLDWHFRQNRRERDSARRAHSRHWHYDLCDWVQYEEVEDLEEREKNWFETGGAEGESEGPKEVQEETPSVPAGAPVDQFCAMCGDKFDQFYNEDKEEWHLRKAVRHEDKNYHPLCFEDYKASQAKEEPMNETVEEVIAVDKVDEVLEIKDIDDIDESDNESVVEVVEPEEVKNLLPEEPVEIDEGEEDDVVLNAEPVEQVVVEDEVDTDDETRNEREERDQLAMIDFSKIKVKQEPVDPDDEAIITAEEEVIPTNADTTHTTVLSSIDGNVQLDSATATATSIPLGGIRINISKSIPTSFTTNNIDDKLEDISADDEPLPPGEEPELEYKLKPNLEEVQFSRQPPIRKGNELSGLCSIM